MTVEKPEKWVVVIEAFGALEAEFIVGRLRAEDIPARMWTESVGRSLGITVGKLGTSYVEVPASHATRAQEIINTDYSDELDDWDESETE